ncbi:MAG: site-2 protease family protein [Candidatus Sulfotelmatobacter sp.]
MSTATPDLIRNCQRCSRELPPGALVCDHCHALVHSEELERLSAEAKELEAKGDLRQAREKWLSALPLLPTTSNQADWIKRHAEALDAGADPPPAGGASDNPWVQQRELIGPITGQAGRNASPMKAGVKLTSILSFLAFIAIYSIGSGVKFGIGFAALILIHEMGHFIDIKRRGLPADMPVFLPGLGAYVRWQAMGVSIETRAAISLAGPLAGFFASVACAVIWYQTGNPLWAALARVGAILNLLNLIPVWVLDGGQAALALSKTERLVVMAACGVLGLALGQWLFLLVGLGAGYRALFATDFPSHPSRATTVYFIAVLIALGVIIRLMPGHGLGLN